MSTKSIKVWFDGLPADKKRKIVVGGGLTGVMLAILIGVMATDDSDKRAPSGPKRAKIEASILTGKEPQKVGIEQIMAATKRHDVQLETIQRQLQALANQGGGKGGGLPGGGAPGQEVVALPGFQSDASTGAVTSPGIAPPKASDKAIQAALQTDPNAPSPLGRGPGARAPQQPVQPAGALPPPNIPGINPDNSDVYGGSPAPAPAAMEAPPAPPKLKLRVLTPRSDEQAAADPSPSGAVATTPTSGRSLASLARGSSQREPEFYLPMGSIMSGTLLTGVDAPASGSAAKKDPFPALFRVKHEAILPNSGLLDLRECFIVASAYGDLSSERVYMRAEGLSCQRSDGAIIEATLDAYASGGDGKAGIKGTVVEKTGQLIGRSLLAGFVSGLGKGFSPKQSQQVQLNPQPGQEIPFQYPSPDFVIGSGLMGGASTAAERIASIYEDLARQIVPVIEVHAGIPVDFIMTRGATLRFRRSSDGGSGRGQQPAQLQARGPQAALDGPVTTSVSGTLGGPFSVTPGPSSSTPPRSPVSTGTNRIPGR